MLVIIGFIVVIAAVMGGYLLAGGVPLMIWQPPEYIIIIGAAFGSFVASSTSFSLKLAIKGLKDSVLAKPIGKAHYLEILALLYALFNKMYREGIVSIEKDIENPEASSLFQGYPAIAKDKTIGLFIGDTLRVLLSAGNPAELDKLMASDVQVMSDEAMVAPHEVGRTAESLPGMGVVAAVLGVTLAMAKINAPPEELGHAVAAALVGTFIGILMCYGFAGPLAAKMENMARERKFFFNVIREAVGAAVRGSAPIIALEYGRRAIPYAFRPTFLEMEEKLRG